MIRMVHPQHGVMHCYSIAEVEANEKNGWKREPEPVAKPQPEAEPRKVIGIPGKPRL